jgi:hypothetical protein
LEKEGEREIIQYKEMKEKNRYPHLRLENKLQNRDTIFVLKDKEEKHLSQQEGNNILNL